MWKLRKRLLESTLKTIGKTIGASLLLVVYFGSHLSFGQSHEVDSAAFYREMAVQTSYNNTDSMRLMLAAYKRHLNQDPKKESDYLSILGIYYQQKSQYDSSLYYQDRAYELASQIQDSVLLAQIIQRKGNVHKYLGNYELAMELFFQAMSIAKAQNDTKTAATAGMAIGQVYGYMQEYDKARDIISESLEYVQQDPDDRVLWSLLIERGNINTMTGMLDAAEQDYSQAKVIAEKLNLMEGRMLIYSNLGAVYFFRNEMDKAIESYQRGALLADSVGDKISYGIAEMNTGEAYYTIEEFEKAEEKLLQSLELFSELKSKNFIKDNYYYLYEMESRRGDDKKALKYYQLHAAYKDSIINESNLNKIAELQTQYKTVENEKLLAENQLEIQEKEAQIFYLYAGFALFIILAFAVYYRYKANQRHKMQLAIAQEREQGLQNVVMATESERNRISKDLHDGVGQQLSALKLALADLSNKVEGEARSEVESIASHFKQSADEVRSISHQMMPRALMENGLVEAIEDMLQQAFAFSSISYQFEHKNVNQRFDEHIEIGLYRVLQELINNIIKHSQASNVQVQLYKVEQQLMLLVEDDGKGLENKATKGYGLKNIESRLSIIHGKVNFESAGGTTAIISVPVK
ncbi:tetratricopeptide repeat protein [Marivirga atlantica]|uniref:histidine kinase n=1 Tax=Marivirga atlantica TaxID=1548457 RepID=A0A937A969_9BACT|nr:tetratricopeptide repeat protein [Marivirga atlantica]MBL0766132.1 sensor histidine kinase [Marivirga atlantica]